MKTDPIDWSAVQSQLKQWALKDCNQPGVFNDTTSKKFMERIARATINNYKAQFPPSYGIYHFYDPEFEQINEFQNHQKGVTSFFLLKYVSILAIKLEM